MLWLVVASVAMTPGTGSAAGQESGELRSAVMTVSATSDRVAVVSVDYMLLTPPSLTEIPFQVLVPPPAAMDDLRVWSGTTELPVRTTAREPLTLGTADIASLSGPSDRGRFPLTVRYRVDGVATEHGDGIQWRIPIVAVPWAPRAIDRETFSATVTLDEVGRVRDVFPTTGRQVSSGPNESTVRFTLQVVPAFLRFRSYHTNAPMWTPGRLGDVAVLVVLVVLAGVGLRRWRRTA